jgi:hypothetical protein
VYSNVAIVKIDKTPPTISDIPDIDLEDTNLLAHHDKNFSFDVSNNWWSPISYIWVFFEDSFIDNSFKSIEVSNSWNWSKNHNIQNIDLNRTDWKRIYTLRITRICDTVDYCIWNTSNLSSLKDYNYNVYANTTNLGIFKFNSISDFKAWKIADWTLYELKAILKDTYLNEIVPASWISRTIDFNFDVINTLSMNQYNNSWDGVYLTTPDGLSYSNKLSNNNNFNTLNSSNWEYLFKFKVYAPTINWNDFNINSVRVDVNWTIWNISDSLLSDSDIDFDFTPLYTTNFLWNQKDWLVEWVTQSWSISIVKNWDTVVSGKKIYLQKDWTKQSEFKWEWTIASSTNDIINSLVNFVNSFIDTTEYILKTLFTLDPSSTLWFIDDIDSVYIKTWIWYTIDSKPVLYNPMNIWDTNIQNNFWLKIYWLTNINESKQRDLTNDQNDNDIRNIAWEINKSNLKRDIKRESYKIIKNLDTDKDWIILMNWKIEFYDYKNELNKIKELSWNLWTDNTIIILWADAYITWDLEVWWIIVLKDDDWNGWKIYIDPDVAKIKALIYSDKSAISYSTVWGEISPNNGWTYEVLKNQLYIHGSLFSENTIWGSRLATPVCPFYKYSDSSFVCDLNESQKYDLNYLRRWIINSQHYSNYPVVIEYNSKVQLSPPPLFSK